jgi:hypothetical protein
MTAQVYNSTYFLTDSKLSIRTTRKSSVFVKDTCFRILLNGPFLHKAVGSTTIRQRRDLQHSAHQIYYIINYVLYSEKSEVQANPLHGEISAEQ